MSPALIVLASLALTAGDDGFFEAKVRPVLARSCGKCHGATKQEGGLRLDDGAALLRGGDTGPAVVPGKPAESLLIRAVERSGELEMPPDRPLPKETIADLTRWVADGARWPSGTSVASRVPGEVTDDDRRFWSFLPIADPAVPSNGAATAIDAFLRERLASRGMNPAPAADRRTLIRRASFDLTGLPPTPEEIDRFLADEAPGSFGRLVDRLLASPAYGEKWGRRWLDLARYADTAGESADFPVREAFRYRDYVITAFNRDMPYDQFLREQVAGDLLAADAPDDRYGEKIAATGFLALSRRFGFDPENYNHLMLQDTIDTLGQSVLGLSLGCARCHHHKFDPVTSGDYYALYGIFAGTRFAYPGSEHIQKPFDFVPLVPPAEAEKLKAAFDARIAAIDLEIKALDPKGADHATKARERAAMIESGPYPVGYAVVEGKPADVNIQKRGEPTTPGAMAPRRFLQILGGDPVPTDGGSGRRALAGWLTRPSNPLTARVMVNRIWQGHFGRGLVATENDFGRRGAPPTHPELLDHLAHRFVDSGWSIKAMHRMIMNADAYAMSGAGDPRAVEADPDDSLLSRFPRRRLDAEEIRDAMLAVAGTLDRSPAGPHPFPPTSSWRFTQHQPFSGVYETQRRSVYLMTTRLKRHPYLSLFDGPDPNAPTARRSMTTVPTQALFALNDPFVHAQAEAFARRIVGASTSEDDRLRFAFVAALGRPPTAEDAADSLAFLRSFREEKTPDAELQGWSALARTLIARNEFVFLD